MESLRRSSERFAWVVVLAAGISGPKSLPAQAPDAGADRIHVTRGPYLQTVVTDRASVVWRTDSPSLGRVTIRSEDGAEEYTQGDSSQRTAHELSFTGLIPGTLYSYTLFDGDRVLETGLEQEFRTATLSVRPRGVGVLMHHDNQPLRPARPRARGNHSHRILEWGVERLESLRRSSERSAYRAT